LGALHEFKSILRGLLSAQELLSSLGEGRQISWQNFLSDLKAAINSASINPRPGRMGRVLVTTAADARGLPHDHVFILGLSEGVFPAQVPEDLLYLDSERKRFRDAGVYLATQAERAADDGLFYELISLPRKSLTLSRPTVQEGKLWIESHLWRATRLVFSNLAPQKIGVGAVVNAADVASVSEAALTVADQLNQPSALASPAFTTLCRWVQLQPYWQRVALGRAVELERMSRRPHNRYSGRLEYDDLIRIIATQLGPEYVWSATKLNDLGVCGFRFFSKHLLGLEELVEPEDGMDALQLGTLNHDILEKTYRKLRDVGVKITPEYCELAVEMLHQVADDSFHDAPERLGFKATPLWEHEKGGLLRRLETLIRLDFSGDSPLPYAGVREPYFLEAPFGMMGTASVRLRIGEETLLVRGKIDRMDRIGDDLIVIDYKTGSTKIQPSEIEAGRNFQMMVYLTAAAQMLEARRQANAPHSVIGGVFWHIRDGSTSRPVDAEAEVLEQGRSHLARYLSRIRQGDFAAHANTPDGLRCTRYCEFSQMCRIGSTSRHKNG
jgi:ATP-dependent helicase/nuclease subunit B